MQIYGFQKLTLLDYPEHIAATVFTGGCNFRCPFCQNGDLVENPGGQPLISEEDVLTVLRKRQGILQGLCITGGEPTLQKDLKDFVLKVKELGYFVKLDTNGYRPEVLQNLLQENLLDYVAMDVKAALTNYEKVAGCPGMDTEKIRESILLLKDSGIPYEFRTTVVKGLHTLGEFEEIGQLLAGAGCYYLQAFRESERLLGFRQHVGNPIAENVPAEAKRILGTFTTNEMEQMASVVRKYVHRVELRGVE